MEFFGMSVGYKFVLEITNLVLTGIFVVEMILKIIGLTWTGYIRDGYAAPHTARHITRETSPLLFADLVGLLGRQMEQV